MTTPANPDPQLFGVIDTSNYSRIVFEDEVTREPIDSLEVFEALRHIKDPEHPLSLELLRVIEPEGILVDDTRGRMDVRFTPTVPHCSMTALIGLCIREKLRRCFSKRFKATVKVTPGSHEQETAVNRQLNDKERVAAAMENMALRQVVAQCIDES